MFVLEADPRQVQVWMLAETLCVLASDRQTAGTRAMSAPAITRSGRLPVDAVASQPLLTTY